MVLFINIIFFEFVNCWHIHYVNVKYNESFKKKQYDFMNVEFWEINAGFLDFNAIKIIQESYFNVSYGLKFSRFCINTTTL